MTFIKTVLPSSYGYSEPTAVLVDMHSAGIDIGWMHKRSAAGVFRDVDLKPEPGHSVIHLIAMGASDRYGCNRNGDAFLKRSTVIDIPFPKEGCEAKIEISKGLIETHESFEKLAKVYRHHCFAKGTPVLMSDYSYKFIERISEGDEVITHTGKPRKVVKTYTHDAPGTALQLRVKGIRTSVEATGNHPMLVIRRDATFCRSYGCNSSNRCYPHTEGTRSRCATHGCSRDKDAWKEEWMPAEYIRHGDYVCLPRKFDVDPSGFVQCDDDAYFLGLAFAEGCFSRSSREPHRFDLTFSSQEEHTLVKWVLGYLGSKEWKYRGPYYHKKNHTFMIQITDVEARRVLEDHLGGITYSHERRVSPSLLGCTRTQKLSLLAGYMDGDGCWGHKCLRGRSTSFDGLQDFLRLAHSVGIVASVHADGRSRDMRSAKTGLPYDTKPSGVLTIHGQWAASLQPYCLKLRDVNFDAMRKQGDGFVTDDYVCLPITSIVSVTPSSSKVYNLEVFEDSTYVVSGVVAHNCNKDPQKSEGDVIKSAYNQDMDRVELLIKVANDKWAKDLEKLSSGGDLDFSMSTKVPYDICTYCGNKARNRGEYCDHLTNDIGSITKKGHQIAAMNDHMSFFDISQVTVPADRIARGLLKAASKIVSGSELAEAMDLELFPPLSAGDLLGLDKLSALKKLSDIEKTIEAIGDADSPFTNLTMASDPEECQLMSDQEFENMAVPRSQTMDLLGGLADKKICLSLQDFLKLVTGDNFDVVEPFMNETKSLMPGIFGRMLDKPDDSIDNVDLGHGLLPRGVRDTIEGLVPRHGMSMEPVNHRMTIMVIRGKKPSALGGSVVKVSSASTVAHKLAKTYAMYKLAFCQRAGLDEEPVARLAVLQHYIR